MSTDTKGPPLFGLPIGGVAFGLLWVAGAVFTLNYCFFGTNYFAPLPVPAVELAIANAAFAKADTAEHRPAATAPQP
jgi:hypothetical protein